MKEQKKYTNSGECERESEGEQVEKRATTKEEEEICFGYKNVW